jgi:hypothetical protein
MQYRKQRFDFRLQSVPISTGEVDRVLRYDRFCSVGSLTTYLMGSLIDIPLVQSSKHLINLVNVTNWHSGTSWGACPPPVSKCVSLNKGTTFTFALSWYQYSKKDKPYHIRLDSMDVKVWSIKTNNGDKRFITVNVDPVLTQRLGLGRSFYASWYLYNVVGMMTKKQFQKTAFMVTKESQIETYLEGLDTDIMYNRCYLRPIGAMVADAPYPFFVFSRSVWASAPNLFVASHFTPLTTFYFFRNIRQWYKQQGSAWWNEVGRHWVARQVLTSLVELKLALRESRPLSVNHLLYPIMKEENFVSTFPGTDKELLSLLSQQTDASVLPAKDPTEEELALALQ